MFIVSDSLLGGFCFCSGLKGLRVFSEKCAAWLCLDCIISQDESRYTPILLHRVLHDINVLFHHLKGKHFKASREISCIVAVYSRLIRIVLSKPLCNSVDSLLHQCTKASDEQFEDCIISTVTPILGSIEKDRISLALSLLEDFTDETCASFLERHEDGVNTVVASISDSEVDERTRESCSVLLLRVLPHISMRLLQNVHVDDILHGISISKDIFVQSMILKISEFVIRSNSTVISSILTAENAIFSIQSLLSTTEDSVKHLIVNLMHSICTNLPDSLSDTASYHLLDHMLGFLTNIGVHLFDTRVPSNFIEAVGILVLHCKPMDEFESLSFFEHLMHLSLRWKKCHIPIVQKSVFHLLALILAYQRGSLDKRGSPLSFERVLQFALDTLQDQHCVGFEEICLSIIELIRISLESLKSCDEKGVIVLFYTLCNVIVNSGDEFTEILLTCTLDLLKDLLRSLVSHENISNILTLFREAFIPLVLVEYHSSSVYTEFVQVFAVLSEICGPTDFQDLCVELRDTGFASSLLEELSSENPLHSETDSVLLASIIFAQLDPMEGNTNSKWKALITKYGCSIEEVLDCQGLIEEMLELVSMLLEVKSTVLKPESLAIYAFMSRLDDFQCVSCLDCLVRLLGLCILKVDAQIPQSLLKKSALSIGEAIVSGKHSLDRLIKDNPSNTFLWTHLHLMPLQTQRKVLSSALSMGYAFGTECIAFWRALLRVSFRTKEWALERKGKWKTLRNQMDELKMKLQCSVVESILIDFCDDKEDEAVQFALECIQSLSPLHHDALLPFFKLLIPIGSVKTIELTLKCIQIHCIADTDTMALLHSIPFDDNTVILIVSICADKLLPTETQPIPLTKTIPLLQSSPTASLFRYISAHLHDVSPSQSESMFQCCAKAIILNQHRDAALKLFSRISVVKNVWTAFIRRFVSFNSSL